MNDPEKTLAEITQKARNLRKHLPEMGLHYDALNAEIYRDGALSAKQKRLMALCAAVTHGCEGCMLFQAEQALALGAGRNEIFESLAVAIGLGGSMASSKAARVMSFLEQRGLAQPKTDPVA